MVMLNKELCAIPIPADSKDPVAVAEVGERASSVFSDPPDMIATRVSKAVYSSIECA
jgi:hypothetical protein